MKTRLSPALAAFLGCSLGAFADVKLPALISDNMVLLQDTKANVWGTADAGEKVTVKLGDKTAATSADQNGKWSAKLEGLAPGSGKDMTVAGKNTLTVKNVAVEESTPPRFCPGWAVFGCCLFRKTGRSNVWGLKISLSRNIAALIAA